MRYLIILLFGFLSSCRYNPYSDLLPVKTQKPIDLNKYSGSWYEIASFPNSFQKNCICTKAFYKPQDKYIEVINTCYKNGINNKINKAKGKAFVVPNSGNSKLKVQFFWPFKGDYWIIHVSKDYQTAIVGDPYRRYLWILSRTKSISEKSFQKLIKIASDQGYDITKLKRTKQICG